MTTPIYPPTRPSIFGPIVSGQDVEQHCIATTHKWLGTYLAEVEQQHGLERGAYERPRRIMIAPTLDKMPEDQIPAVVFVSIGLAERPAKSGDGTFRGRWDVGAACICSARTQDESHAMAMNYTAALRALLLQRPSLDGWGAGVDWQGEQYDQLDYDELRSIDAGFAQFTVEVYNITLAGAGPLTPDEPLDPDILPWPDWAIVETTDVTVDNVDEIDHDEGRT